MQPAYFEMEPPISDEYQGIHPFNQRGSAPKNFTRREWLDLRHRQMRKVLFELGRDRMDRAAELDRAHQSQLRTPKTNTTHSDRLFNAAKLSHDDKPWFPAGT
jgi:hypothetical protein